MQEVTRLGVPFRGVDGVVSPFRLEMAKRILAIQKAAADAPMPAADRAWVRTEVAREFSGPSTAGTPSMPENWRDRSRKTPDRGHKQLLVMT